MGKLTIKRPEKLVPLCLDASLRAEWEQAEAELVRARRDTNPQMLTGNADAARLAERVRELEDQMRAQTVHFRLRALPRADWARLVDENPKRDGNEIDSHYGFNHETFYDAVITAKDRAGVPATIVSVRDAEDQIVDFDVDEWSDLADEMTDQQYADFANAVMELNRGKVSVPFSRVASRMTTNSDEDSSKPNGSASPTAASSAGSRKK